MPRPLKNVSPDTLGGRIRAARQTLHLSLSEVAGQEYSTSLISQIERNKIEPSAGSLKYLAERRCSAHHLVGVVRRELAHGERRSWNFTRSRRTHALKKVTEA